MSRKKRAKAAVASKTKAVPLPAVTRWIPGVWAWAILAVAAFIVYFNTFYTPFHLDDYPFIIENPNIRSLGNFFGGAKGILGEHARFIPFLTFALNYHFHQLEVFGYHLVNFVIHVVTSGLVWSSP